MTQKSITTLMNYIQHSTSSLEKTPFCELDALVLSVASYLLFEKSPTASTSTPVSLAFALEEIPPKERSGVFWLDPYCNRFTELLCLSPRFRDIKISNAQALTNTKALTQFGAVCFHLPDDTLFLSFRGTDNSLVGWEEDFALALMNPIPSQRCALAYARLILSRHQKPYRIGGHSKGGNLAFYTALMLPRSYQQTLLHAYSFDGPGFPQSQRTNDTLARSAHMLAGRLTKIVPAFSFVGAMFSDVVSPLVIASNEAGIMQHMPFSWKIQENAFIPASRQQGARVLDTGFSDWMDQFEYVERVEFCAALFGICDYVTTSNQITTLPTDLLLKMPHIVHYLNSVDTTIRTLLLDVLFESISSLGDAAQEQLQENVRLLKQTVADYFLPDATKVPPEDPAEVSVVDTTSETSEDPSSS